MPQRNSLPRENLFTQNLRPYWIGRSYPFKQGRRPRILAATITSSHSSPHKHVFCVFIQIFMWDLYMKNNKAPMWIWEADYSRTGWRISSLDHPKIWPDCTIIMHWKSQFISSKDSFLVESFELKIIFSLNSTHHFFCLPRQRFKNIFISTMGQRRSWRSHPKSWQSIQGTFRGEEWPGGNA